MWWSARIVLLASYNSCSTFFYILRATASVNIRNWETVLYKHIFIILYLVLLQDYEMISHLLDSCTELLYDTCKLNEVFVILRRVMVLNKVKILWFWDVMAGNLSYTFCFVQLVLALVYFMSTFMFCLVRCLLNLLEVPLYFTATVSLSVDISSTVEGRVDSESI
jgi:hypothetical protein